MDDIETPGLAKFFNVIGWIGVALGLLMAFAGLKPLVSGGAGIAMLTGGAILIWGCALVFSSCLLLAIGSVLTYLNRIAVLSDRNGNELRRLMPARDHDMPGLTATR